MQGQFLFQRFNLNEFGKGPLRHVLTSTILTQVLLVWSRSLTIPMKIELIPRVKSIFSSRDITWTFLVIMPFVIVYQCM
jgi:hypothetical protein